MRISKGPWFFSFILLLISNASTVAQSPTLVSIAVTPGNPMIASGGTQQFKATGTYSDGSTQDLTPAVQWNSSNSSSVTIGSTGTAIGLAPGAATIGATEGSIAGSTGATVADTNLAAWWRFDDGTGASAADTTGNGNTATLANGMTWVSGQIGDAISADGSDQYAQIPAVNLTKTQAVTLTAWINRTWGSGPATLIENSSNFNAASDGFGFFPDDSGDCGSPGTMMTGVHGNVGYTLNCYKQPSSGAWHHIAVVYDKSQPGANVISLYIDGILQMPVSQPYTATNTNTFGDNLTYFFSRDGTSQYTAGEMDDLRLYDQALTAAQIEQIYLQGLGTLTSIAVTPANGSVVQGGKQQYAAVGTYSNGSPQNLASLVLWSSSNPAAATISASGLATGVTSGSANIVAVYGAISGSTSLTVNPSTLQLITVSPANPSIVSGNTQQFTATGTYSDGSTQNLTSSVTWSSANTSVARITPSGFASGVASGSTEIRAASGSIAGSALLIVTPVATLVSISVAPTNSSLLQGGTQQLSATGTYSDGSTQDLTNSVLWSSTNTATAIVGAAGLVAAEVTGSATIQATYGSVSGSASVSVLSGSGLVGWWKFDDGSGTTAADSSGNGNTASLFNGVSWVTGLIGDAISDNGNNQYEQVPAINLTTTQAVTWTAWVNRTWGSGSATLIENSSNFNAVTDGFGFFPDDNGDCGSSGTMMAAVHGNVGYTLNCYRQPSSGTWHHIAVVYDKSQPGANAISLYIDGVLQTPTSQPSTATNTNTFGDNPTYVFSRGGTSQFAAGDMDDLRLYDQALTAAQIQQIFQQGLGTLTSITVTPTNVALGLGTDRQFTATGGYSSGQMANLTSLVAWSSSNTAVAAINSSGLLSTAAVGTTTIQATSGSVSGTTGLTVTTAPTTLVSISVAPANFSLLPGDTQQLTATGTYSDGSTQNLTNSLIWSSTNSASASVDASGLVTAVATGSSSIQATSGSITGSAQANVLGTSSLLGWWQFDDGSGTTGADSSGNGNTASLYNGIAWVAGETGDAISANGSNQYAEIPAINLTSTQAVTWTAWVNRTWGSGAATLLENSSNFNAAIGGFGFFPDDSSDCGSSGAMMTGVHGNMGYTLSCYKQPSSGTWHHIAVVYDMTQPGTNAISLFVDGALQTPVSQPATATNTNTFGNNPTYLFARGGTSQFTTGEMDDLRLYDQALTAAQIQQVYQEGLGLTSITIMPSNATFGVGTAEQYTAIGTLRNGASVNLTNSVTWSSANAAIAAITPSGLATAEAAGPTTIVATSGNVTGTTGLLVTSGPTVVSISIAPSGFSLLPGGTEQLTATGTYSDGSTKDLTTSVTWNSTDAATATANPAGLVAGVATGNATIEVSFEGMAASAEVTVLANSSLAGWWKFDEGTGAVAADSSGNGNTASLLNGVTWIAGQIGDAIAANGSNQYAQIPPVNLTASQAVTWTAWVNRNWGTGSATLIENSSNFNEVTDGFGFFPDDSGDCSSPGTMMTGVHGNVGYTLSCYNQPSSNTWHHIAVVYDKSQPGANVISLYIDGVLQAPVRQLYTATNTDTFGDHPTYVFSRDGTGQFASGGMYDLRLYSQALTAAQIQQIYQQGQGTLQSISVSPTGPTVADGGSTQFQAIGTYSGGSTANVTNSVTWTSTNTSTATVSASGFASAVATGTTAIQATLGTISGSAQMTVAGATLQSLVVMPGNQAIPVGGAQQFTATGIYSNGSVQDLTNLVTWISTNPSAATISSQAIASGISNGTTTIEATYGPAIGTTPLTVTTLGATLQSILVSPTNVSIQGNATQQMTATGTYSDGSTQNLTPWATWSSSNTAVATINSSGLVTTVAAGNTSIGATFHSIAGMSSVVVKPSAGQFVQFASGNGGSTQSQTTTQNRSATSGNLILVFSHWDNVAAVATVQDQLGNTYTPVFQPTCVGGTDCFQVWYAKNIKGGAPLAVTITYSTQTISIADLDVIEYSGLDPSDPLDVTSSAAWSGTKQSSENIPATTSALETIIGLFGYSNADYPYTAGQGFTFRNYDATTMVEDESVSSIGVYNANASSATAGNWTAFTIAFRDALPTSPGLTLNPASVTAGSQSMGTVILNTPAPPGGTTVTLSSGQSSVVSVPANITVPEGSTSVLFPITTSPVQFTTAVPIYATSGAVQTATLTVVPQSMSQIASDSFNRASAPNLGSNWTTLVGTSVNVPMQIVNGQIESSNPTSIGKEMYFGGQNWTADQYSQVQILAAGGDGEEGPAVRMTSNDTYYGCLVKSLGAGTVETKIVLNYQTVETELAISFSATVAAGDTIRCAAQGTTLTMTDVTSSVTLLTATDRTIPAGYPGVVDAPAGTLTSYVMANWSAGASAASQSATQFASDNFNRADSLDLGSNWVIGYGHGPIQIVNDQIQPYPDGGPQPSKEHFIADGPFPNDQWSQVQVVYEDAVGDIAPELRASDSADTMYVCDANITGGPGTAETRIVKVVNGVITALAVDNEWSSVSPGDYIRGQVQGSLISLIDVTTGTLLLTTYDTDVTSGYPGISLQAVSGNPTDHIGANWSAGGFK